MICSAVPVSMMFLLVAPQWTKPAARAGRRARSAFTSGITGFQVRSNSRRIARRSMRETRAARPIARAAERGTRPSSACVRARAASTSSQRWIVARSSQIARIVFEP